MDKVRNILERIPLDNKLLTTVLTAAITRAVLAIGLDVEDPLVGTTISLIVGAAVGYFTPNEGTDLRQGNFDNGNPEVPTGELGEKEVENG